MKLFVGILLTISTVILQITLVKYFPSLFNIPFVFLISWAIFQDYKSTLLLAFTGGFILDILSMTPFGLFIITFVIITFLINVISHSLFSEPKLYVILIITFIATVIYFSFYWSLAELLIIWEYSFIDLSNFLSFQLLAGKILGNLIAQIILFKVFWKVSTWLKLYERQIEIS
ncbi:hypothetical protein COY23_02345 [bacterium (Candidatus Torokbacteria) CG_4_10_14_0_2_um_filter_35_8]|nr:MAG: hypothetical protein COY23_02345 [bacterium (Candidatus Torokbacteria) CG_4_10_14_0_2_um_filter_35_8]